MYVYANFLAPNRLKLLTITLTPITDFIKLFWTNYDARAQANIYPTIMAEINLHIFNGTKWP
jgi:hypothetical protein